ncbi:MAG TPA: type II toxin-antitoxin system HicA family toxin [Candidatus Acidoferrales bacterium]|nr:type II toxin-antitoxin system HicA family toxin [Candidatus Acidoferrales bacterium]
MSKLPVCSGTDAIRAFERAGWAKARQKGSHATLTKAGSVVVLTVPMHKELGPGLLRSLVRKAGITVEEFADLLNP